MAPAIERTKSDDVREALKRLASISYNYHPEGKELQSSIFVSVREGQSICIDEVDELSTVSCVSFSDDDFSLTSIEGLMAQVKLRPPLGSFATDYEDISTTSMNSHALKRITELTKKLEIQENTKLKLLNKCVRLETEMEKVDSKFAIARILKSDNAELREQNAKMQLDLMNEISKMAREMKEKEENYERQLKERDTQIKALEEDLKLLRIAKNVDDPRISKIIS